MIDSFYKYRKHRRLPDTRQSLRSKMKVQALPQESLQSHEERDKPKDESMNETRVKEHVNGTLKFQVWGRGVRKVTSDLEVTYERTSGVGSRTQQGDGKRCLSYVAGIQNVRKSFSFEVQLNLTFSTHLCVRRPSLVAQMVKNLPVIWETRV